jgi:predicted nucleic acid-binding protein
MLDTNICGYLIRDKPENLKEKLKEVDLYHTLVLSVIVVSELLYGAKKKNNLS